MNLYMAVFVTNNQAATWTINFSEY